MSLSLPKHRRHLSLVNSSDESSRDSSLQTLWDNDYYADELDHVDVLASPRPAALTERPFPRSIPLSINEASAVPRETRTQQRSITPLLPPFRSPQRSPERSPLKEKAIDFMPTLTGDKDGQIKIGERAKGISGWFSGSSSPLALGIPSSDDFEDVDMSEHHTNTDTLRRTERSQTMPSTTTSPTKPTTTQSRFSFFGKATKTVQLPMDLTTDLLRLDVHHALFPTPDSQTFSPTAFQRLQVSAEALLSRMQAEYKSRSLELHELREENAAQADELEEASTRASHLKMQLEDMSHQFDAKDALIERLTAELAIEREERELERIAREKSIELVKYHGAMDVTPPHSPLGHRKARRSDCSFASTDGGYEGSEDDSVFSRSMSPTFTDVSSVIHYPSGPESPEICHAKIIKVTPAALDASAVAAGVQRREAARPAPLKQRSTFEKLMGRSQEGPPREEAYDMTGTADEGCANCRGGSAEMAWDTVGLLKIENKGLKERVAELDRAVECALDCVAGLDIRA